MTGSTSDDDLRASTDPGRQPPRSKLRELDEQGRDPELDAVESDDALEGDRPVLEVDTSGVARTHHSNPLGQKATDVDPLFGQDAAADFRARWDVVQRSFVDDPTQAVRAGDELVTEVIQALSAIFTEQRMAFDNDADSDRSSTEALRLALRRYRSLFERLLTI